MAVKPKIAPARVVTEALKGYAERGVFRGLSHPQRRGKTTAFTMLWHHGRRFRFVMNETARVVSFPDLLPGVPARSPMFRELKAFLHQFESDAVPEHRRIDPRKGRLKVAARAGAASVTLSVKNGEWEYCSRRLVHLAQEVYMVFLHDGPYSDYRVAQLGLDPESVWA
jgi:hypothetical protein